MPQCDLRFALKLAHFFGRGACCLSGNIYNVTMSHFPTVAPSFEKLVCCFLKDDFLNRQTKKHLKMTSPHQKITYLPSRKVLPLGASQSLQPFLQFQFSPSLPEDPQMIGHTSSALSSSPPPRHLSTSSPLLTPPAFPHLLSPTGAEPCPVHGRKL